MNWRAFAGGVVTLIVIETVTRNGAAGRVGGLLGTIATIVQRAFSPDVAAIPDLRVGPWPTATPATTRSSSTANRSTSSATIPTYPIGVL